MLLAVTMFSVAITAVSIINKSDASSFCFVNCFITNSPPITALNAVSGIIAIISLDSFVDMNVIVAKYVIIIIVIMMLLFVGFDSSATSPINISKPIASP